MTINDAHMPEVSRASPRRPRKEFGEAIVNLAREKWKTTAGILKAMGYAADPKNNTLRRLAAGEGSDTVARTLLDALKKAGADTSKLPPMYDDAGAAAENWRAEWAMIGELLHDHAQGIFEREIEELRPIASAIARKIGAELDLFRPT